MSNWGPVPMKGIKVCPCCSRPGVLENFITEAQIRCINPRCGIKIQLRHISFGEDETTWEKLKSRWNRRHSSKG